MLSLDALGVGLWDVGFAGLTPVITRNDVAWERPEVFTTPGLRATVYLFETELHMGAAPDVYLDNDLPIKVGAVMRTRFTDYVVELATGLTDVTAFLSLTSGLTATTIHPDLEITLTEITGTAVYVGGWEGDILSTHLSALANQVVYLFAKIGTGDFRALAEVTIRDERPL